MLRVFPFVCVRVHFLNATASHRTLASEFVYVSLFVCLFVCLLVYYTRVYVCYLFSGRSHFAIYLG